MGRRQFLYFEILKKIRIVNVEKTLDNYVERFNFVEQLFFEENIDPSERLIRIFTIAYQVGEPCHTFAHLLWFEVISDNDNFMIMKLINLYKKWGREHGHFLRVYNKDGRDKEIYWS